MIPRTVQMAKEVSTILSSTELKDYGNIIVNGYSEPNLADFTPLAVGSINTIVIVSPGGGYTTGTYTGVYLGSGQGSFAYGTVVINGAGNLSSITIETGGQNYVVGNQISFSVPGGSPTPANVQVDSVNTLRTRPALKGWTTNYQSYFTRPDGAMVYSAYPGQPNPFLFDVWNWVNGVPQYSQCPRRFYQNQVAPFTPPTANQQAIQYSFMYPVQTIPTPPPIDYVTP